MLCFCDHRCRGPKNLIAACRDRLSAARPAAGSQSTPAPVPNQTRRDPGAMMQLILHGGIPSSAAPAG